MAKKKKIHFFRTLACGHCGNISNMVEVGYFAQYDIAYDPEMGGEYEEDSGSTYMGLTCPACNKINVVRYYWHDGINEEEIDVELLYPQGREHPKGLPSQILDAYNSAVKVMGIDVHLYATAVGRLLELVCNDKGAKRSNKLDHRLKDLHDKGEIPLKLIDVANGIKDFRNIGAHAGKVILTKKDIPIVNALCVALLEYIYSAPYLAQVAENTLNRIRTTKPKSTK